MQTIIRRLTVPGKYFCIWLLLVRMHARTPLNHILKSFVDSSPAGKARKCFCIHYPHYCMLFLFRVEMSIFALRQFDLLAHGLVLVASCFTTITNKGKLVTKSTHKSWPQALKQWLSWNKSSGSSVVKGLCFHRTDWQSPLKTSGACHIQTMLMLLVGKDCRVQTPQIWFHLD